MADNITIVGMINLEEFAKNCEKQLNDIIKNSTYSELTKYSFLFKSIIQNICLRVNIILQII